MNNEQTCNVEEFETKMEFKKDGFSTSIKSKTVKETALLSKEVFFVSIWDNDNLIVLDCENFDHAETIFENVVKSAMLS